MKLPSRSIFRCVLTVAAVLLVPLLTQAGEWRYRLYGYTPRNYGSYPSNYVFPRYGFTRGYVYFEGPAYGSPALDDPRRGPPVMTGGAVPPCPPVEEIVPAADTASDAATDSSFETGRGIVRPAVPRDALRDGPPEIDGR